MFKNSMKTKSLNEGGTSMPNSGADVSSIRCNTGKITHDSRGNAIWEWGVTTGVFARIKSSELLNMLEDPTLALEGECQMTVGEWSGDPYNRR